MVTGIPSIAAGWTAWSTSAPGRTVAATATPRRGRACVLDVLSYEVDLAVLVHIADAYGEFVSDFQIILDLIDAMVRDI
jgi:hypothetical protein